MGKDCRMLEFLKGGIEEDDNGIELSLGLSIGGNYSTKKMDQVCNSDDKIFLESQRSQKKAIYRGRMENERVIEQKFRKKRDICTFGKCGTYDATRRLSLALNQDLNVTNHSSAVDFWGQNNVGKMKKNELEREDCGSSRLNIENRGGNLCYNQCRSSESNGSLERCSSTISECLSPSPKGRSSSDNAQGTQPSTSGRNDAKFELLTSNVVSTKQEQGQTIERTTPFGAKIDSSSDKSNYSTRQANEGLFSSPLKQSPVPEIKKCDISLLSQMPCVSTTGNGPNGKTVRGLLYRYDNRKEVSIICVCHGKSFTPAEFVEHAGGIDVDHPLRHITVIPPCS